MGTSGQVRKNMIGYINNEVCYMWVEKYIEDNK